MAKKTASKPYKSNAQISISSRSGRHTARSPRNQRDFASMDLDPTIALAKDVVMAMAMREPWTVEGDDALYNKFLLSQITPYKKSILRSAINGMLRPGWRIFETRYTFTRDVNVGFKQTFDGFKPLRNDATDVVIDAESGDFLGCITRSLHTGAEQFIDKLHCVWINQDDDGFGEYGQSLYERAHSSWDKWNKTEKGAQRYDEKVAGGYVICKYPVGSTPFAQRAGELTDNGDIADVLLNSLESAGRGKIPVRVVDELSGEAIDEKIGDPWKIEHIAAGSGGLQPSFISRLKYHDAMKLRAFGLPERSVTEGSFGTKAEAEAHGDIAVLVNHDRHENIVSAINSQSVKTLNRVNTGDPGSARLVLGDLDTESRQLFSAVFTALMGDPINGDTVSQRVDLDTLLEKLRVPVKKLSTFAEGSDDAGQ